MPSQLRTSLGPKKPAGPPRQCECAPCTPAPACTSAMSSRPPPPEVRCHPMLRALTDTGFFFYEVGPPFAEHGRGRAAGSLSALRHNFKVTSSRLKGKVAPSGPKPPAGSLFSHTHLAAVLVPASPQAPRKAQGRPAKPQARSSVPFARCSRAPLPTPRLRRGRSQGTGSPAQPPWARQPAPPGLPVFREHSL